MARHILPNALTPVIVSAALGLGNAITLEASLSFLGVGVQPPTPSWGNMIASGRDTLLNAPWVATAPGVALVLVVVACTLLGDALQGPPNPAGRGLGRKGDGVNGGTGGGGEVYVGSKKQAHTGSG